MKKVVNPKTDDEIIIHHPLSKIIEGWFFRIDEISMGHFRVEGIDRWGRSVSREGNDPDELLNSCRIDILEMFPID